jgi:hypothetical protein
MVKAATNWSAGRWGAALATLRDARWLSHVRVTIYTRLLFAMSLVGVIAWIGLSRGGLDREGKPLGTDFLSFWAAARLALAGHPALAYDVASHAAAQRAAFGGAPLGYAAFFYPPLYLLVCLPLGLAPYFVALAAWLATTAGACWLAIRRLLGPAGRGLNLAMLAFPGVLTTLGHGQNAFLTTALFALGVTCLDRRPILAGVFVGLLAFKPHLGLLIPLALIASGRWTTVVAAAATVLAFALAALVAFGVATWRGFLAVSPLARAALEQGLVGFEKMPSVFAATRLLGGGVWLAYGLQALAAGAAGLVVVHVARRAHGPGRGLALGATLAAASLLASPFLLDYDLMLLAIPLAWLAREGRQGGFRPWEKTALFVAFVLPLAARLAAQRLDVPLGPPVVCALLWVVARRALDPLGEPGAAARHGTVRQVG